MTSRWDEEALRRIARPQAADQPRYALFAVGRGDVSRSVSPTMTRLNLANTLDRASALGFATLLVGPPPGRKDENQKISELAAVCEESAARRGVPYVDMYGPLARHDQWATDMDTGHESLPLQAGYGLMAWLVLHSRWHAWLGIDDAVALNNS
jgi:hypothetical protein